MNKLNTSLTAQNQRGALMTGRIIRAPASTPAIEAPIVQRTIEHVDIIADNALTGPSIFADFIIPDQGIYQIMTNCVISNTSTVDTHLDYVQSFISKSDITNVDDFEEFNSIQTNALILPGGHITNQLSSVIFCTENQRIVCYVNMSSDANENFEIAELLSSVKYIKL